MTGRGVRPRPCTLARYERPRPRVEVTGTFLVRRELRPEMATAMPHAFRMYIRTASTRRWSSAAGSNPSLPKMDPTTAAPTRR